MSTNTSVCIVGTLKERKDHENRVGLTPLCVAKLQKTKKVSVIIERGAGIGSGFSDAEYHNAGAKIVATPKEVVTKSDIIVKIKEIIPEEYPLLGLMRGKTLFAYLHLAGVDKHLTKKLLENEITAIAYELVTDTEGKFPLLSPMSIVAGWQAVALAEEFLQKKYGGKGIVLGRLEDGAGGGNVVIIGTGVVGLHATRHALALGAQVIVFGRDEKGLKTFKTRLGTTGNRFATQITSDKALNTALETADVVVGAVLLPGAKAPHVLRAEHLKHLPEGSVVIDVAIDQGGCTDWSRTTSHSEPIYRKNGVVFCCIPNIPGAVPRTSTEMLTRVTLPFTMQMATNGVEKTLLENTYLRTGLETRAGKLYSKEVAETFKMKKYLVS